MKKLLPLILLLYFGFICPTIANSSLPSISHLDSALQSSINSACTEAKLFQGAAKYIACIKTQLAQIGSKKLPSITHLDSALQSSINSACIEAKLFQGATKYIACIKTQLAQIGQIASTIPTNSHKVGTSWVCNTNYYRNNAKTGCLYVPANSTSSYSSNYFKCNTGFSKSGGRCLKKAINNNNSCPGSYSSSWTNCSGTYTYQSGDKYIGFFKNGNFNGQGTYTWTSGQKYVGGWKDDKRSGQGTHTWPSGQKYVGGWKDGEQNGQGTLIYTDGRKKIGNWNDMNCHECKEYD